jgi:hypothetical protein
MTDDEIKKVAEEVAKWPEWLKRNCRYYFGF